MIYRASQKIKKLAKKITRKVGGVVKTHTPVTQQCTSNELSDQQRKARQRLFGATIRGRSIAYVYIRKNACTSWKWVFAGLSKAKFCEETYPNIIQFMGKYYAVTPSEAQTAELRIAVIRDPIDRVYSAFMNQFVQRLDRQGAIHRLVSEVTGEDIRSLTFRDFVTKYLVIASPEQEDAHLWSQKSHLGDLNFNELIPLDKLYERTEVLFGRKFARTYFHKPRNTSRSLSKYGGDNANLSVGEMFERFKTKREIPSKSSLLDDETINVLKLKYAEDIRLYSQAVARYV